MSNSIWKTGYPTYRNDNFDEIIVREYKRWADDGVFYLVDDCTELPNRWAYLLDIIAQADKAERLQKIAERQNEILQDHFATLGYYIGKEVMDMSDEIKQLTKD